MSCISSRKITDSSPSNLSLCIDIPDIRGQLLTDIYYQFVPHTPKIPLLADSYHCIMANLKAPELFLVAYHIIKWWFAVYIVMPLPDV